MRPQHGQSRAASLTSMAHALQPKNNAGVHVCGCDHVATSTATARCLPPKINGFRNKEQTRRRFLRQKACSHTLRTSMGWTNIHAEIPLAPAMAKLAAVGIPLDGPVVGLVAMCSHEREERSVSRSARNSPSRNYSNCQNGVLVQGTGTRAQSEPQQIGRAALLHARVKECSACAA